jgi:TAG lipase / steryl ester hydrolase / phospholipase A2 / LPA acyltransferase
MPSLAHSPTQRLRELFNVNHFIVSQVNPHVVPLLRAQRHPRIPWLLSLASSELDFRLHQLSSLEILPVSLRSVRGAFTQSYTGDITIVPDVDAEAYTLLLTNPTEVRLQRALSVGQYAAWPKIGAIETVCKIELALERIVRRLRGLERWTLVA